jgi:transcriptional regulator with XRE-family HTH domain
MMENILEKLDKLRKEKGISIFKLTELAGLSENTIYNWYNKGSCPTIEALKAVCDVLNISLSCFFAENINESISAQEEEILSLFRALTPTQKELSKQLLVELNKGPKKIP